MRILQEPKNAIVKQYKKYFELEGVDLHFTDEALTAIARKAVDMETGARGLRAILESLMLDIMYDLPTHAARVSECHIDEGVVKGEKEPIYIMREDKKDSA